MDFTKEEIKSFQEKLSKFSENELNEKERDILGHMIGLCKNALTPANVSAVYGEDEGFLKEIEEAQASMGEVNVMTTVPCATTSTMWCAETVALTIVLISKKYCK